MITVERNYFVDRKVEDVFNYLSNPENDVYWQRSCTMVNLLCDDLTVGSAYKITFDFMGRELQFDCSISELQTNSSYGYRTTSGPFFFQGNYAFKSEEGGTAVQWKFESDPKKYFGIVPVMLVKKALVKQVEKDVEQLRTILQSQ